MYWSAFLLLDKIPWNGRVGVILAHCFRGFSQYLSDFKAETWPRTTQMQAAHLMPAGSRRKSQRRRKRLRTRYSSQGHTSMTRVLRLGPLVSLPTQLWVNLLVKLVPSHWTLLCPFKLTIKINWHNILNRIQYSKPTDGLRKPQTFPGKIVYFYRFFPKNFVESHKSPWLGLRKVFFNSTHVCQN